MINFSAVFTHRSPTFHFNTLYWVCQLLLLPIVKSFDPQNNSLYEAAHMMNWIKWSNWYHREFSHTLYSVQKVINVHVSLECISSLLYWYIYIIIHVLACSCVITWFLLSLCVSEYSNIRMKDSCGWADNGEWLSIEAQEC